jgi:hypothetical protein
MHEQPLTIKKTNEGFNTLYVPEDLFRVWVQKRDFPRYVSLGKKTLPCKVGPHPLKKNEYLLSEDLWVDLNIPHNGPITLIQHHDTVHLGPLVAIFTAGFTDHLLRPLGERTMFFSKLMTVERKIGAFYFIFGAHHIDWENGTIDGFFHTKAGWKQLRVPFPNVVYDRLPNRKTEKLPASLNVKSRFENDYQIPWFNPGFFDKWTIHKLLQDDVHAKNYLPETYLNPSSAQIEKMIDDYHHVYLKPSYGSLGIGIQQVFKQENDAFYYCRFRANDQNRLRRYSSLKRLQANQFPKGLEQMLVQRGIHLLKWHGNAIDFRIHTNKDQHGDWKISAAAAKIAGSESVTTHITNGGKVVSIQELVHEMGQPKKIVDDLKQAALTISKIIDERSEGYIGEIGFDLGVDTNQRVWLFEANSKPGRSIFSHQDLRPFDLLTRALPLTYACYLARQSILHREAILT